MAEAATTSTNAGRASAALAALAWAYLAALSRGDSARASALLSTFQALYSAYRDSLMSKWDDPAADEIVPRRLTVGSGLTDQTRLALQSSLIGESSNPKWDTIVLEMPPTADKIAVWWESKLKPLIGATTDIWVFDELARTMPPSEIPAVVGGEFEAVVLGLSQDDERPAFELPSNTFRLFPSHSKSSSPVAPSSSSSSTAVTPSSKPSLPTWAWVGIGAGVLVLGGAAAYFIARRG